MASTLRLLGFFRPYRAAAVALVLHLLVGGLLSAAPDLHALLHDHAHDESHVCAITLFQQGGLDHHLPSPALSARVAAERAAAPRPARLAQVPPISIDRPRERGPPLG